MQLHPDGLLAAMGTAGREVRLYDLRSGESVATFGGHSSAVGSVAFSESGIALASGADDGSRMWDLRKSKCVQAFGGGAAGACSALAFDSSGILLACGSASGAVAVYDARVLGADAEGVVTPLCSLSAHKAPVAALAWTARALVSAGLDGVLSSHTA
jgi:pre-mRNA-processing factor 19